MREYRGAGITTALVLLMGCSTVPKRSEEPPEGVTVFTADDLLEWDYYGIGEAVRESKETLRLSEGEDSKGVMIISPATYGTDVAVSYRVKAVNSASVLVAILSLSDPGAADQLTVPDFYDGDIQWLLQDAENYFFAFHNAAHNTTPFIRRHPGGGIGGEKLASLGRNILEPGVWYTVEAGRQEGRIWLMIDGKGALQTEDPSPLSGGRFALRIRGTADRKASCLIQDVTIWNPPDE